VKIATTTKSILTSLICLVSVVSAADDRNTTYSGRAVTPNNAVPQPDKFVDCGPMDATDFGVESATRSNQITSTCATSVTQVPSPCDGGSAVNWGPGNNCAASTPASSHGQNHTLTSTNPRYSGSAQFQCINGAFYPSGGNSTCVYIPQPCPAGPVTWNQGEIMCSASAPAMNHSQRRNISNTAPNRDGTASFLCTDGTLEEESGTCVRTDKPCGPRVFNWAQGSASCSFNYTGTAGHNDQFTLTVPQGQTTTGSITQRCVNGAYQQIGVANCQPARQDAVCRSHPSDAGYPTTPATSLESACVAGGSFDALPDDTTSWRWRCNGIGGGANANCSAFKLRQDGLCRAHPGSHSTQPATNTANGCAQGTYSNLANDQTNWRWQCVGVRGGASQSCSARITAVTPVCRSHPGQHQSQPANSTSTACTAGTYSDLADTTSEWHWQCTGAGGPSPVSCAAQKVSIAGQCRPYTGKFQDSPATSLSTACNAGPSFSTLSPSATHHQWTCNGQNGGADSPTCIAERDVINGRCTTITGAQTTDPSSCDAGDVFNRSSTADQWSWVCRGSGGGVNVACNAVRFNQAACGSANGQTGATATSQPVESTRCASGNTVSNYVGDLEKITWSCATQTSTIHNCRFNRPRINGQCGSNNGTSPGEGPPVQFRPTTNLCSAGITEFDGEGGNWRYGADDLTAADGTWNWVCQGTGGGSTQFCSRAKAPATDGACGNAHNHNYPASATTWSPQQQCSVGNPSTTTLPVAGGAARTWTCSGVNGGASSGTCSATRSAAGTTGACGTAHNHVFANTATTWSPKTQCAVGTPSNTTFPAPDKSATWTCSGLNGGASSGTCSTRRNPAPASDTKTCTLYF